MVQIPGPPLPKTFAHALSLLSLSLSLLLTACDFIWLGVGMRKLIHCKSFLNPEPGPQHDDIVTYCRSDFAVPGSIVKFQRDSGALRLRFLS